MIDRTTMRSFPLVLSNAHGRAAVHTVASCSDCHFAAPDMPRLQLFLRFLEGSPRNRCRAPNCDFRGESFSIFLFSYVIIAN